MNAITIKSLMDVRFLSSVRVSPDAMHTAYVETIQNEKENRYESRIRVRNNQTGAITQLTHSGKEASFLWDDEHTLLFPTQREKGDKSEDEYFEKTAYYRIDLNGGEAYPAFSVDKTVTEIRKVEDGVYCLLATIDLNKPAEKDEDYKDVHVLEEAPFWGNGRGFISRTRASLFLYRATTNSIEKITPDLFDVSTFDLANGRILYAGQEYAELISVYSELRAYEISTKTTSVLVPNGTYSIRDARITKSGVLMVASDMKKWGHGQLADFYRMESDGKNLRPVWHADGMHIGPDALGDCTHGDGKTLVISGDEAYFIGMRRYMQEIYQLSADDQVTKLTSLGALVTMLDQAQGALHFAAQEPDGLTELYALDGGTVTRLTNVNAAFLAAHKVAHAQHIPFTNSDGWELDGWILKPFGYEPGKKYPAVLEIHGGPRCAYSVSFFHEMQSLAGAGYFVFFCNPRGSEGYGEAFADLRGKYGDVDYRDLMEFTDHVLKHFPDIDEKRLGAAGGSYGGFMCNWIEGHTNRFAAIASQRSVSNWVADFGASEIGVTFDKNEMSADPWTDMYKMWDQSPLKYANNARTPILFIHSMCDYNCTLDQGVEMFTAMKYFGVPARMCVFEGENHSLSRSGKPRHRLRRLSEIINWFDQYLK